MIEVAEAIGVPSPAQPRGRLPAANANVSHLSLPSVLQYLLRTVLLDSTPTTKISASSYHTSSCLRLCLLEKAALNRASETGPVQRSTT